ncbi:serine hydrolase domain-containing protein [Danxiaibacter flavus]|uniref:Serine hydrolase domain-containing protein n=1 Tax=Danxiaibacter flavus TaxID=3049108 RepID=A0ABV3ZCZ0_9BACT|nr:serine hydrolase domain-containing protein [Chitinophagaceae bacterium DXS]
MAQKPALICLKVSALMTFLLFFQTGSAQYNFGELDSKLQSHQKELSSNVVTLIYKGDKVIYQKEMGDFKANTVAPIASCSKWLTAALVMQFVDEGKLSLDDKVSKYLPIFNPYGKGFITIRQCLSHTTGIAGEKPGLMSIIKLSRYNSLEEEVNDFASKHELQVQPGIEFRYSAIGLNIAGRVLEVIAKKPFDRIMQEKLFRPLNMRNTTFASEKAVNPSGGAKSTANDYMNFLVMLLNKGMFNGKRLLSEQSVELMQQPVTNLSMIKYAPAVAEGFNYALGEWVQEADASGKATCVASPGLFGTWPLIDTKRGYAAIVFVKTLLNEQKKDIYMDLKGSIDEVLNR